MSAAAPDAILAAVARSTTDSADRPATSHDVAALAGVSQPTVSRALRGDARVSAATQRRVAEAAAKLNYIPSERGRSLSTRRTRRVGVVVDDLSNPFYLQLLDALHRELESHGTRVLMLTSPPGGERAERLVDGSVDGVAMTTVRLGSTVPAELRRRRFPFVLVNREIDDHGADACVADNVGGGRVVADELARLGHREVGAIFGPANTSTGRDREAGFRAGLAEHGLRLSAAHVRHGEFSVESGHRELTALADAGRLPTAVFCANDVIALGAMNAARALGIDVPADLTVIGFDDIDMAGWDLVRLTTVRQDLEHMARAATELLMGRIGGDGDRAPERVCLPVELVGRDTHGPPRA